MDRYIGKYRVDIERDMDTGDPLKNGATYLRCVGATGKNGGKVYRYNNNTLVAYIPNKQDTHVRSTVRAENVCEKFDEKGIFYKTVQYDNAMDIYFDEVYLDEVWEYLSITKYGAIIPPASIKNHTRRDEIRQERYDLLSKEERERRRISGEKLMNVLKSKEENG